MAVKQLDTQTVVDELTALTGTPVTVEVHAPGCGSAPRAILTGTVGALSMDDESKGGAARGLVFVPVGPPDGRGDPGCRPGIYFEQQSLARSEQAECLTIALKDQSFFVIKPQP